MTAQKPRRPELHGPARQADAGESGAGRHLDRPLITRSMASPPDGSVRFASSFSVKRISIGCVRPRWVASFMTFGLPISFTKARPSV